MILARPGRCPIFPNSVYAANNCTVRNSCDNDTECTGSPDEKCCPNGCGGTACYKAVYSGLANHLIM